MIEVPTHSEFVEISRYGYRVPVCRELPLQNLSPLDLLQRVRTVHHSLLLESGKDGRYSYVTFGYERMWRAKDRVCEVITSSQVVRTEGNPFELLRREFEIERTIQNPRLQSFSGGAIGYLAYDMARHIEVLPNLAAPDLNLPDSCFVFVDRFYEFDHHHGILRLVCTRRISDSPLDEQYESILAELDGMAQLVQEIHPRASSVSVPVSPHSFDDPIANLTPEEFAAIVRLAKDYIVAGDIFQVNLSVRFQMPFPFDSLELYQSLLSVNPSPFMGYLEFDGFTIVSASPELLLKVHSRTVETRPIAGTRPRGANDREDVENARELIENEKECAEHVMLVDLERNDIGRVAKYGSVEVNEFMGIERYSHVIHIVSNVRGELAEGCDVFDAIVACFPGGTITGAPKVRSMEIIDELEPTRRGVYTGSIGWIGYDGNAELNIAIRTIVVTNGTAYVQAGAGIVADSVPELEYIESRRKAEAGLLAVRRTYERLSQSNRDTSHR